VCDLGGGLNLAKGELGMAGHGGAEDHHDGEAATRWLWMIGGGLTCIVFRRGQ
jgi:hypothetical protein